MPAPMSARWCFTINNPSAVDETTVQSWGTKYLVYGREVGDSGTPHLQGFVSFVKNSRLSAVKKLHPTAHWEIAKGTSLEASDYCKKDGDFFERGTPPFAGQRTDLEDIAAAVKAGATLKEVFDLAPATYIRNYRGIAHAKELCSSAYSHHDVRGVWFHGAPGTGKSHAAREMYPNAYMKSQNKWFDGYAGEAEIILDDFDHGGKCLGHHLKIWLDKYPCSAETKGGKVHLQHRVFIITSNYTPLQIFGRGPDDKENGQDDTVAAILRRVKVYHFKSLYPIFHHPQNDYQGPVEYTRTVDPPLPTGFYDNTQVDP